MRALRLPVGAKRRGNPFPLVENSPLFVIARRAQPDVAIRNPLFSAFPYRHYQRRTDCHGRKRPRNDKIGLF